MDLKEIQKVERVSENCKADKEKSASQNGAKESNLQKKSSMRKNLKVKIKLPIENMQNMTKIAPKKERKIQKCCLVAFLLVLFILATGILIYFFGKPVLSLFKFF